MKHDIQRSLGPGFELEIPRRKRNGIGSTIAVAILGIAIIASVLYVLHAGNAWVNYVTTYENPSY